MSCRLCKAKSHIPLSCDEFKKENGISERRVIEEARTEALIRTCGKCKVRILKEDGCNKVICTKCYAVLCDYCGKDISKQMYNHFDGQGRAPPGVNTDDKTGKCPLYDESHKRKDQQVDKAEKEAMAKVRAEHPDLSEEDLKIKFAKEVQSSSNRNHGEHRHHVQFPPNLPHHVPHHPHHGRDIREAPMGMLEGVCNMLDEFGGIALPAVPQVRDQGRQARERARTVQQQALQQAQQEAAQLAYQQRMQHQMEALLRQQQQAALLQQDALVQQDATREDLRRRLEQARRTAGINQASRTHDAHEGRMSRSNHSIFQPLHNGVPVLHNDRAQGNNARAQNVDNPNPSRARRQSNVPHRTADERSHDLAGARNFDRPTQERDVDLRRRHTAENNAERAAERAAEGRRLNPDPFDLDRLRRMPSEYPGPPRRGAPPPEAFNPWVPGANNQAYF